MVIKICGVIMSVVGVLALILSLVSLFTAGTTAVIYFILLGIFCITVGRWWI